MRRYLLDSGPLAAYLNGRPAAVQLISPWIARREVATSIVVYGEIIEYFKRSTSRACRASPSDAPNSDGSCGLSIPISQLGRYADIRRGLRPPHGLGLIGDIDTLIAATAIELDLTIVTTDGDFERVPNLKSIIVSVRS